MKEERVLTVSDRDENGYNEVGLLEIVLKQKKQELSDINHNIMLAKNNLRLVQDNCIKTQNEFDQKVKIEKQKFEDEQVRRVNDFATREEKMKQLERNQNERNMALGERELAAVKITEERQALYNSRIEIEKIKNAANEELNKGLRLQGEAQAKIDTASLKLSESENNLVKIKQEKSATEYNLDQIDKREKDIKTQLDNLEKIREEIDPKIAELEGLKKKNEDILAKITAKENSVNLKLEEDKKILAGFEVKQRFLRDKEIELNTKQQELIREEMLVKTMKEK